MSFTANWQHCSVYRIPEYGVIQNIFPPLESSDLGTEGALRITLHRHVDYVSCQLSQLFTRSRAEPPCLSAL